MAKIKLKPCPFCGGKAKEEGDGQQMWYECRSCGARAGIDFEDEGPNIKAWNRRHNG